MAFHIREATPADVAPISEWTSDTFIWGDYVPGRLESWLSEPDSVVLVSADEEDAAQAVAHVVMLSPSEGWLEGARVHPHHRRSGLGSRLNQAGVDWAREMGARVVRLATEASNQAARSQVAALGYRQVSSWVHAQIEVPRHHRAPDSFRLRPAPGSDAEAAWLFWVASDLARESREMIALGWRWRTARPEDVTRVGDLYQSPGGWLSLEQPEPDWARVQWMATTPDDILVLLDGLVDLAAERGVSSVEVKLPTLGWTAEALRRQGADPEEELVFAKPVG